MRVSRAGVATAVVALSAALSAAPDAGAQSRTPLVRIPLPAYDGTLTPYTFETAYPLVTLVYDTLLWRDARGVPRPWLARSVRRSNGGRRVTIHLNRGVRWHDGRALTAADVAFTFDFVARRFHPRFTPQVRNVRRATAAGPLSVVIDLRRPSRGFDDQPLADVPILPRHLWQGLPEGRPAPAGPAVGSGPYRLLRAHRRGYRFRQNAAYFKRRPQVERIRVPIIEEERRTYSALRRRKVDMLPVSLPEAAAESLGGSPGINVERGPSYVGTALQFDVTRPPFDRPAVRRAVGRALDLDRLTRNVGPAVPAQRGYVHPSSPWAPEADLQRFDLAAARRSFAELDLPEIRILAANNDPQRLEAGRQVALALRRAGAAATVVEVTRTSLGREIGEDGPGSGFGAAVVGIPPLVSYDPDFLAAVFGADPGNAPLNFSGYRSPAFERLAARVAGARTVRGRRRAAGRELRRLASDLPAIPLFFSEGTFAFRPAIHDGWLFVKGAGILDKRSFLRGGPRASAGTGAVNDPDDENDSGGALDVLRILSFVALAIVLVLAAIALYSRRKAPRS